jgi:hypothetical protein
MGKEAFDNKFIGSIARMIKTHVPGSLNRDYPDFGGRKTSN